MAEAHENRTHQGDFSSPSPVLKTGAITSIARTSNRLLAVFLNTVFKGYSVLVPFELIFQVSDTDMSVNFFGDSGGCVAQDQRYGLGLHALLEAGSGEPVSQ